MLRSTISWLEHLQIKKVVGGNVGTVVGKTVFFYIWLWNIEKKKKKKKRCYVEARDKKEQA
jgi:hypothetical protein